MNWLLLAWAVFDIAVIVIFLEIVMKEVYQTAGTIITMVAIFIFLAFVL